MDITVVIPTIAPRANLLARALKSIDSQSRPAAAVVVQEDIEHLGAATTRDRGLRRVETDWVAFLDDDDVFMPQHLEVLASAAEEQDSDYVFSWYMVKDAFGRDQPSWGAHQSTFGQVYDVLNPTQTTVVTLVRTELAQQVGFLFPETTTEALTSQGRLYGAEDWLFTQGCVSAGAKIWHAPQRTWWWYHWGRNTSGLPQNW